MAFSVGAAQVFDEVPDVPVSGCTPPNMSKRTVNLNGSPDSRLGSAALHFVNMPSERFDWSDRHAPQAAPPQAGLAPAGLAEAAPPSGAAAPGAAVMPGLVVRTRRSVHEFQPGTTYRIGRDPDSDIVMTDLRVSGRHGVLRTDGDVWVFEDLGSTNGTFLGTHGSTGPRSVTTASCAWATRTTARSCAARSRPQPRPPPRCRLPRRRLLPWPRPRQSARATPRPSRPYRRLSPPRAARPPPARARAAPRACPASRSHPFGPALSGA